MTNNKSPFSAYAQSQPAAQQSPPSVRSPFGEFPNLQAYLQHQDAHEQQRLTNQREYNKALSEGRPATKVPVMEAWKQAGENIKSGAYKGNPFATGNVDGIMSMFDQYGMQTPDGFRDQLIQFLGPQAPPSALTPPSVPGSPIAPSGGIPVAGQQPGMQQPPRLLDRPGDGYTPVGGFGAGDPEYQQWRAGIITDMRFRDPIESAARERYFYEQFLRERQGSGGQQSPMTGYPIGPNGEYWPASGPGMSQGGPSRQVPGIGVGTPQQPPAFAPGYGGAIDLPPGVATTADFKDKDGDGVDDRFQPGPGMPRQPRRMPRPDVVSPGMGQQPNWKQARDEDLHRRVAERAKQDEHARLVAEMQAKTPGHIPITRKPGDTRSVPWTPDLGRQGYQVTGWQRAPQQPTQGQTPMPPPAPSPKPAPVGQASPIPERTQGTPIKRPEPKKPKTTKPPSRAGARQSQALLNQAMAMLRSGGRR